MAADFHPVALEQCLRIEVDLPAAGFELAPPGYWRVLLPGGGEVAIEPIMFGRFELAVYDAERELVLEQKVPLRFTAGTVRPL